MRRSRVVLSIAAVLVLSAGLVVGRLSGQLKVAPVVSAGGHGGPGGPGGPGRGWFSDTLDLTPDQRRQMDGIWTDARGQIGKTWDRRHELDHERDAAVRALLSPPQAAAYDKVWTDYRAARSALDQDRDRLVRDADDRSKRLLTDVQRARWEAMSKDMHDRHPGGPGPPPPHPTTRPDGGR